MDSKPETLIYIQTEQANIGYTAKIIMALCLPKQDVTLWRRENKTRVTASQTSQVMEQ